MIHEYYDGNSNSEFYGAFRSVGYLAEAKIPFPEQDDVLMDKLPPLLRTLLVTDGTVTKSLEAFYWEPVTVDVESLELLEAKHSIEWLNIKTGEKVLTRQVRLRGNYSNKIYATAFSVVRLSVMAANLREALINGEIGIGVLIRDSGLESYREILDIRVDRRPGQLYATDSGASAIDVVSRTYRIISENQPMILITESFPWQLFE
jgi:chorismate-pyruvate lyase